MTVRAAVLLAVSTLACSTRAAPPGFVIDRVTVVDVAAGRTIPDQRVTIAGDRIVSVGPSDGKPASGVTIDGGGKFLVPGFWDMHVHLWQTGEATLPVLVAWGVTGARDMGGDFTVMNGWRRRIVADSLLGPRLLLPGPRLDGPPNTAAVDRLLLTTPDAAVRAVDSLASLGVDFLKVYEGLPASAFFALAREARAKKLAFAGHVPRSVSAVEASDSGQKSIEHLGFIPPTCLVMFDPQAIAAKVPVPPICRGDGLDSVAARLARNGTWLDPTLVSFLGFVRAADTAASADRAPAPVSPELRSRWREQLAGLPKWPVSTWQAVLDHTVRLTGLMARGQVPILAGTDLGNPEVYPGVGLHQEMALLVRAGLSPAAALRAATWDPVRYLGLADSLGTVTGGKLADLVLLDGDPLADIGNTRRIDAVIVRGRLLRRPALDSLLR